MVHRYAEMVPDALEALWSENGIAILPLGALEWHGNHLPLGLDGLVAEHFAERLAERLGAVLLPTIWLPMTTLPHRFSLQVDSDVFRQIVLRTAESLQKVGACSICVVTGHYAQGQMVELYQLGVELCERPAGPLMFIGSPLEVLGRPELLDHAGRYELSQLASFRPDLVRVEAGADYSEPHRDGVLGEDPRKGTAEDGVLLLSEALDWWTKWVKTADRASLIAQYRESLNRYAEYDRIFKAGGTWEEAIVKWWETKRT